MLVALAMLLHQPGARGGEPLDRQLARESPAVLAADARKLGDPARGALLFYQPQLGCAKCHRIGSEGVGVGPDLSKADKQTTDAALVESILLPSKTIKKGFEAIAVATKSGRILIGLLAEERAGELVLRDPGQDGPLLTIAKDDIDERRVLATSIMPDGIVNQLENRQQFLDLVRYVVEIAEKG